MSKAGLMVISELERNVLEVALDHMKENLEALIDENKLRRESKAKEFNANYIQERLDACNNLQKAIK
mgnify:FL=1